MAMLAEPRRKQKIGPNPRGLFFTEDDQNRGRNMLQKMGWKDGSGLGLTHQGISVPIKPKVQQNSKGLGFDVKEDPWVAHNDKFSELLQNLNSASEGIINSGTDRLELEKTSKSSKSRIHYQKFVRNKDLSKCSNKDWECIFGRQGGNIHSEALDKPTIEEQQEGEVTLEDKFVSSGSMADYFKQKFAQKGKRNVETKSSNADVEYSEMTEEVFDAEIVMDTENTEESPKKKKKKEEEHKNDSL